MSFKLIVTDLDGTLLNSNKEISLRTAISLKKASEKGIYIIPCTGRTFNGIPSCVRSLPFIKYAIICNGGCIWDVENDRPFYDISITYKRALEIFKFIKKYNTLYDCYINDWGWIDQAFLDRVDEFVMDDEAKKLIFQTRTGVDNLISLIKKNSYNVQKIQMFFKDMEQRRIAINEIKEAFPDIVITSSIVNNIEINNKLATKGSGLSYICDYLNISLKDTIAFGDNGNDISMLQNAGFSVVMSNGTDEAKSLADYITDSNDADGVAKAIEELILY